MPACVMHVMAALRKGLAATAQDILAKFQNQNFNATFATTCATHICMTCLTTSNINYAHCLLATSIGSYLLPSRLRKWRVTRNAGRSNRNPSANYKPGNNHAGITTFLKASMSADSWH
eukprot:gnl/MRDRNA2_/MRDRNA2_82660_c0_seq2.p1 gnl/MRDRNA2_/MRDRNA2_82660_c0~~gnl/MRDRNA2_/MRDRNA2_82660_c0_seq2.p1  ORF type:complete len:118 (-),score=1.42 gnl/MRDRNA2_/MRDRNA2_82660_c0_seq2:126-479(-)